MAVTGKLKAGGVRRLFTLAASTAVVLPSLIGVAAPQAAAEKAPAGQASPRPCLAMQRSFGSSTRCSSRARRAGAT
jgi:hypothetical protein